MSQQIFLCGFRENDFPSFAFFVLFWLSSTMKRHYIEHRCVGGLVRRQKVNKLQYQSLLGANLFDFVYIFALARMELHVLFGALNTQKHFQMKDNNFFLIEYTQQRLSITLFKIEMEPLMCVNINVDDIKRCYIKAQNIAQFKRVVQIFRIANS